MKHAIVYICLAMFSAVPAFAQDPAPPVTTQPALDERDFASDTYVEVTGKGLVELHTNAEPLSTVLQLLSSQSQMNIISSPKVRGEVTAHLHDVPFEEALDAILMSNGAGYRKHGSFIYIYTDEELQQMATEATPRQTQIFRLNYINAENAKTIIEPMLSDGGSLTTTEEAEEGISSSDTDAGGDSFPNHDLLVVHDYPSVIAAIAEVVRQVDIRPKQVLVEATILRAQLTEDNALGVDFTITGGVNLKDLNSTSTGVTNLTLGDLPQDRFDKGFNSNMTTSFTGTVPDGGMTIGIIKDHIGVFVRALESIVDTTVIANPKVLALNKQRGEVLVGRQDGYPVILTTETTSQQSTKFLETGTRLLFRPYIGDDGYIRMELHPEDSSGKVDSSGQPQKETTEITTNVMVRDGETILIGGLFRESTKDNRSQIPLLGEIPGIGPVFQGKRDVTAREEVIILLTVHIVKDDDYAQAGKEALEKIEQIRVGSRKGLHWFGRERLSQAFYRQAVEDYSQGRTDWALWNVRLALYNNPEFYDAILLRETILNKPAWDDDGSATRGFIHRIIADEVGYQGPLYDRPAPPFVNHAIEEEPEPTNDSDADLQDDTVSLDSPVDTPLAEVDSDV